MATPELEPTTLILTSPHKPKEAIKKELEVKRSSRQSLILLGVKPHPLTTPTILGPVNILVTTEQEEIIQTTEETETMAVLLEVNKKLELDQSKLLIQ